MPEILTESFCERCGTRYTFESVAPRRTRRLGQFRTLSRGVKNWVLSDDASLDEALAAARSDDERELTTHQLDAFHSTFNFCMSCRQYTCANCWNAIEGRCLSCAPDVAQDVMQVAFTEPAPVAPPRDVEAWPQADLPGLAASTTDPWGLAEASATIETRPVTGGNGVYDHGELPAGDLDDAAARDTEDLPEFDAVARLAFLAGDDVETPAHAAAGEEASRSESPVDRAAVEPAAEHAGLDSAPRVEPEEDVARWLAAAVPTGDPERPTDTVEASPAEPDLFDDAAAAAHLTREAAEAEDEAAAGAMRTSDLLARFRPGQNLDAALAAFEAELDARVAAEVELESTFAQPRESLADAEAEAAAAAAIAEPEPVIATDAEFEVEPQPIFAAAAEPDPYVEAPAEPVAAVHAEPDAEAAATAEPEPVIAAEAEAELEREPAMAADAEAAPEVDVTTSAPWAVETEPSVFADAGPEPEPILDVPQPSVFADAEPEPEPIFEAPQPELVAAADPVAEPERLAAEPERLAAEVEPDPVAARREAEELAAEPGAEPPAAEPEAEELAAETAEPAPASPREDRIEQPTWRIFAPEQPTETRVVPPTEPTTESPAVQASAEPQWPVRPGAEESPSMLLLANRARASSDAMWAASAREVVGAPTGGGVAPTVGVRPCENCGLSLSSTARFCRRCGTRQG